MLELVLLGTLVNPGQPVHIIEIQTRFAANPAGFEADIGGANAWAVMDQLMDQLPLPESYQEYWVPEISCSVMVWAGGEWMFGECEN